MEEGESDVKEKGTRERERYREKRGQRKGGKGG
jgi:hypothetical protein